MSSSWNEIPGIHQGFIIIFNYRYHNTRCVSVTYSHRKPRKHFFFFINKVQMAAIHYWNYILLKE